MNDTWKMEGMMKIKWDQIIAFSLPVSLSTQLQNRSFQVSDIAKTTANVQNRKKLVQNPVSHCWMQILDLFVSFVVLVA